VGSGFKTFSPGNVLTASDVNNYFMEQAVMSFADSAARTSAIGTANFEEGMLSYLQDTDTYEAYNGTAWVNLSTLSGGSDAGLVHINTVSFSASSSESLNNVFSSTYDNYRILIKGVTSGGTTINFRLRVSGSDNSTANSYVLQLLRGDGAGVVGDRTTSNLWQSAFFASTLKNSATMDIFDPFVAAATSIQIHNARATSNALLDLFGGTHNQTVSYDGFTIFPSSGTMTGLVSVYGYRK